MALVPRSAFLSHNALTSFSLLPRCKAVLRLYLRFPSWRPGFKSRWPYQSPQNRILSIQKTLILQSLQFALSIRGLFGRLRNRWLCLLFLFLGVRWVLRCRWRLGSLWFWRCLPRLDSYPLCLLRIHLRYRMGNQYLCRVCFLHFLGLVFWD